jgi:hypothetical protein
MQIRFFTTELKGFNRTIHGNTWKQKAIITIVIKKLKIFAGLPWQLKMLMNKKHLLLALLALHCVLASMGGLARAEEDEVEEEDEEGVVEEEGGQPDTASDSTEEVGDKTTSPDADTTILFTRPPGTTSLGTCFFLPGGYLSNNMVDVLSEFFCAFNTMLLSQDIYPGSDFFPSRIRTVCIPDPGSASKNLSILTQKKTKKYDPGCSSRIPDPDAVFLPIPDPGPKGQKGTGSRRPQH